MIEVTGLSKKYGNKQALDNISLKIGKGEIVGFLGPNGAGKSTTMNILTGYISASQGDVKIDGIDILDDPLKARKKIGYLPETPPLYLDMTVKEYLSFIFDLKKIKLVRKDHINEICELVKITDVYDRLIKNLSKGYKQRVGLAQALIGNPEVLILDEPTVGLDPKQIIEIRNLVKSLGEKHTIILSSHILPEVQAVCDKVIIINKGKIVADEQTDHLSDKIAGNNEIELKIIGNEDEIFNLLQTVSGVDQVKKLGCKNSNGEFEFVIKPMPEQDIRVELSKAITNAGFTIVGFHSQQISLEDIFLNLTESDVVYDENLQKSEDCTEVHDENLQQNNLHQDDCTAKENDTIIQDEHEKEMDN